MSIIDQLSIDLNSNTHKDFFIKRLVKDYQLDRLSCQDIQIPLTLKEQFNPMYLFRLDVLASIIENTDDTMVHIKYVQKNNEYICILFRMDNLILISIYMIHDTQLFDKNNYSSLLKECLDIESNKISLYRIHDATIECKKVVETHWVSEVAYF
jgi:hypothetical protein